MTDTNWKQIAAHLYDELRVRGAQCLYNHEGLCGCPVLDCMADNEKAEAEDLND